MKEIKIKCQSCKGSGLYVGIGERDGAAVVCSMCNGEGFVFFKYEEFIGIEKREDVERVYIPSYGYVIAPKEIDFKEHGKIDLRKEGVSYEEWQSGKKPKHIKQLVCPMIADQGACHKIKGFFKECERLHGTCLLGVRPRTCNHLSKKEECWKRFETNK